jgi:transcriptional regulator with XRE-family HTH domain
LPHRQALNKTLLYIQGAPPAALHPPVVYLTALRCLLRMSQRHLAKRSGVAKSHLIAIEKGRVDPSVDTLRRLFDAMFCDLVIVPKPRKRPADALAERFLEREKEPGFWLKKERGVWDM